uniref:C2H2-type domain-containing protein n=1 Tax=Setaria viridis TaxID=4556 RepID=A0A4U6UX88_SETVI|nr:hypothetical protein SEVIR_4G173900v2 [Setaria viridis]
MPKRTSFPCTACSKTFPTQQAMAGHCSAHNRTGLTGHHGLPAAQGPSANSRTPVVVLPYPSFSPFIHPLSNQVIRGPSTFLQLHGPRQTMAIWPPALQQIQAAPLRWGTVFHSYTCMPLPSNAATTMGVVPPGLRTAYSVDRPGGVRADLTLQLGSAGGGSSAQKRTLQPLLEDGRQRKRAAAVLDGSNEGGHEGQEIDDDLDLELRL